MPRMDIIEEHIFFKSPHEKKLRITRNKQGLRGTLLDSYGRKINTAMFYSKDKDDTTYRVKEYFGFNDDNSYCILSSI